MRWRPRKLQKKKAGNKITNEGIKTLTFARRAPGAPGALPPPTDRLDAPVDGRDSPGPPMPPPIAGDIARAGILDGMPP